MKMTKELLQELGGCGDYTRTFGRKYPVGEYPDGVDVTEQTCGEQAAYFSWSWAVDVMLNGAGITAYQNLYNEMLAKYDELNTQYQDAIRAWRERTGVRYADEARGDDQRELEDINAAYNQSLVDNGYDKSYDVHTHMQARAFGRIFDQHPEFRNPNVSAAQERAVERVEQVVINEYENALSNLNYQREQIKTMTENLPQLEAKEAELRAKVAPARARKATARAQLLAQRVTEHEAENERRLAAAQAEAAAAQAEADKLIAEVENLGSSGDATETTSDTVSSNA